MRRLLPLAFCLATAAAQADDSCKPIADAMARYLDTPNHMTVTTTAGGKTETKTESINTGSQRYLGLRGKWRLSPMSKQDELQAAKENAANSKCKVLRDEAVNGEPATVYQAANEDAGTGEYYVSKRSGLPLKEELDIGGGNHLSVSVVYGPQQAPAVGN